MVIIRSMLHLPGYNMERLTEDINDQARRGVIVLPSWCELLNEVPADEEIKVIQTDAARVAELEKELALALSYISASRLCVTCKHHLEGAAAHRCLADCERCAGEACKGICATCHNGSNWEWRGAGDT